MNEKRSLLASLLGSLLAALFSAFPPDRVRVMIDALLDKIEDAAEASRNDAKKTVILGLCNQIRTTLNIPDEIGGPEAEQAAQ